MASGKLTPRQKMINMMYLVLTALLALNISRDVLKAFYKVQLSLDGVVTNLSAKNDDIYKEFEKAAENNPVRFKKDRDIARKIKKESSDLIEYLNGVKTYLIDKTGGYEDVETGEMKYPRGMDNKEKAANYLLVESKAKKKTAEGKVMKKKIEDFRNFMLSLEEVKNNPTLKARILSDFDTSDKKQKGGGTRSWEHETFEELPLVSITTFISKIQGDIVSIESAVVEGMLKGLSTVEVNLNNIAATVIAPKTYVMQGDSFKADIFISAFDDTQKPDIIVTDDFVNGEPDWSKSYVIPVDDKGKGKMAVKTRTTGNKKFATKITLVSNTGDKTYTKLFDYEVASPTAVVSPTKMNVFYKGVKNPIDVSVPGYEPEKIGVSGTGGISFTKTGEGSYDVSVAKSAKKDASVIVKAAGKQVGDAKKFRIKKIPNPTAKISGKTEGKISKSALLRTQGIRAALDDFPFDLKYLVTSFTVRIKDGEYTVPVSVKGYKLSQDVKDKIAKLKSGSDVAFTNIKAKGPDGQKVCAPIVLTIQ